jgi:hypothetical protein
MARVVVPREFVGHPANVDCFFLSEKGNVTVTLCCKEQTICQEQMSCGHFSLLVSVKYENS